MFLILLQEPIVSDLADCSGVDGYCLSVLLPNSPVWPVMFAILSALFAVFVFKWILEAVPLLGG